MKASRVTSLDVAKRAGVSQSAVSRAFTPGASVAPKTIAKIQLAATELGYSPNVLARSLITGKSKMIGFIVGYLDNQFYPESLQKFSERLQDRGYHILMFTADNNPERVTKIVQELLDYQVDAIVAASVSLTTELTFLCREAGVPIVLYNRLHEDPLISGVASNNVAGGRMVAQHFVDIGVSRPAYIAGWQGASTQRDREIGFRAGLAEHGLKLFARGEGNFNHPDVCQATRAMFAQHEQGNTVPDAVFVANDHMAFAVLDILRYELGLRVPDDVSVAGYDDVAIASWPAYNLTSVQQAADQMVALTVDVLFEHINNPQVKPIHKTVPGSLVVRGTTKKSER